MAAPFAGERLFTSLTSAELRGWWQPARMAHPVFASVPADAPHPQRRGLSLTRHPRPVDFELIDGIRVASAADTLLAVARDLGVLDLVILDDSALRQGACTVDQLSMAAAGRRRGAPRLRTAISLLDGRSESPWESVLRLLHGAAADVEVEPQKKIYDEWGRFVARGDLWVVGTRRLHEYDGERTATARHTARTLLVSGAWLRSTGSASGLRRPSWSTKEAR